MQHQIGIICTTLLLAFLSARLGLGQPPCPCPQEFPVAIYNMFLEDPGLVLCADFLSTSLASSFCTLPIQLAQTLAINPPAELYISVCTITTDPPCSQTSAFVTLGSCASIHATSVTTSFSSTTTYFCAALAGPLAGDTASVTSTPTSMSRGKTTRTRCTQHTKHDVNK